MSSAHSPTFPSLYLRHSSFSNPSVDLSTSQIILWSFRCFTYVTADSPTLFSLLIRHRLFTYVTWRAVYAHVGDLHLPRQMNMIWIISDCCVKSEDECALNFLTFVLQLKKNPGKNLNQEIYRTVDRIRTQWMRDNVATLTDGHSGGLGKPMVIENSFCYCGHRYRSSRTWPPLKI